MSDKKRSQLTGQAAPLRGNDLDTDRLIPARFLKELTFEKMGNYFFYDSRFDAKGQSKGHVLDNPVYAGAKLLVVEKNFGCGSSREHAAQAMMRFGINAVIGHSYSEIFAGNCTAIGVPAVTASFEDIQALMALIEAHPQTQVNLDLQAKRCQAGSLSFEIHLPEGRRNALLAGTWDATALLKANRELVNQTADRLPYVKGF